MSKHEHLDLFEQLLPVKWRGVEFPITKMRMSLAHDLVEHKYWGVDGARVEATGLAPIRFTFSAPLTNGIVSGKNERWSILYPTQLRALVAAFQKKATGELQHPEFGVIDCKAEKLDIDWDATRRGGADTELSFVQTMTDVADNQFGKSGVEDFNRAAGNLDASEVKADLKALLLAKGLPLPQYLVDPSIDLAGFMRKIQSVTDAPGLLANRLGGRINSILYHANNIQASVERSRDALTWPVTHSVERIRAGAHDLRQKLLELANRDIGVFRVPADTTLAGIARHLPEAKVGDLIKLNPSLMRGPTIIEGVMVRYYASKIAA